MSDEGLSSVISTVIGFNLMQNLKTGNPMLDMTLSMMILSFFNYLMTNVGNQRALLVAWLQKYFTWKAKAELTFSGEEMSDHNGDVHRRFPETFRAILHHIHVSKCQGVNSYVEIQTKTVRRWHSEEKRKKVEAEPVTYMPNVEEPFDLAPEIICERTVEEDDPEESKKKDVQSKTRVIRIRVFSHTKTVQELKKFLADLIKAYNKFIKEEVNQTQNYYITRMEKIGKEENPSLLYDNFEFVSTRTFDNIFFEQKDELLRRLDFFQKNEPWYKEKGVPYTLGFMLYGPPGTGKTSTIKAIANYTGRHIVEVSLGRIKTYKDLHKVFNETTFCDRRVPHHKIIYILEDIDCLDNIVKARDLTSDAKDKDQSEKKDDDPKDEEDDDPISKGLDAAMKLEYEYFKNQMKSWNKDPLTLSHILNIIDGILECNGRILIITTNQPEKLDSALIRPGRVDMKIHFDWATADDTIKIIEMFYESPVPQKWRSRVISKKFTAAEVYQICFQNFMDMEKALACLTKKETGSLSESQTLREVYVLLEVMVERRVLLMLL